MREMFLRANRWLAICVALLLAGGALAASEQESTELALGYLQDDAAAAIIELRNAIQAGPENPESRALPGEIYLRTYNAARAVKKLERARELRRSDDRLRLRLADARLHNCEYQAVLDEVPADQALADDIGASLLAVRGQALFGLGHFDEARGALERVTVGRPVVPAYAGLARMALFRGDVSAATRHLDAGLAKFPDNTAMQLLRGEQQMQARDACSSGPHRVRPLELGHYSQGAQQRARDQAAIGA